jgi:hypothetical protein
MISRGLTEKNRYRAFINANSTSILTCAFTSPSPGFIRSLHTISRC